jgi:glutaconate CoA-transferase subunit B
MACVFARDMIDGTFGACGMHSEIGLSACLLAQRTTAPNLVIQTGATINPSIERLPISAMDWQVSRNAEAILPGFMSIWNLSKPLLNFEFYGGLQIDQYGNVNLLGAPGILGPGAAAGSGGARYDFYYVYTHRHNRRIFVSECDFITVPGRRARGGLPGGRPRLIVTPVCVFDFTGGLHFQIALRSLHPGRSLDEVRDLTGFEFAIPGGPPPTTVVPSDHELAILRDIDRDGRLRTVIPSSELKSAHGLPDVSSVREADAKQ